MFKTEADNLKEGDRIRLIEEDYYSARCFSDNSSSRRCNFIGWRPVLEVIE